MRGALLVQVRLVEQPPDHFAVEVWNRVERIEADSRAEAEAIYADVLKLAEQADGTVVQP